MPARRSPYVRSTSLKVSGIVSRAQIKESGGAQAPPALPQSIPDRVLHAIYALALAVSISLWFIAIRAPLRLDETGSFWQINAGFSGIMSRQFLSFPAYSWILWCWTRITGTSELALRSLSILAMLGAVAILYRVARELFDLDVAIIAAIVFCLHPIVLFASIDVRPYAFGALAINSALLALVRLRDSDSDWPAVLLGISAACIIYFHFLFTAILPALVICIFALKTGDKKRVWRQFALASGAFVLAFLPVIPGLLYMFKTSGTHVYENAPGLADLVWTLAPGYLLLVLFAIPLVAVLLAALTQRRDLHGHPEGRIVLFCASLALVPVLILYGVSAATPIHLFAHRHRLVAVPGIALCWALLLSRFERPMRLMFCIVLVAATSYTNFSTPLSSLHSYSWKYALEVAEKNASVDNAPVLICSGFIESDYATMPLDSAKDSSLFTPLTYYKLSVPVVPLPQDLNQEAIRVGSRFLHEAAQRHERFLALGSEKSYPVLEWLAHGASATHDVRKLGIFDGVKALEFIPRTGVSSSH
jgi:hypothetical protein